MDRGKSVEGDGSVRLQVMELRRISETCGSNTKFEPQSSLEKRGSNAESVCLTTSKSVIRAPETKLTLFALRLSIFEKAATGLGTLGFIWATVVLLGGFAITLDKTDFWFVTIILLIEGTRIFSRSRELEWQHQATWSIADAGISSFRMLRSSSHVAVRKLKSIFTPIPNTRKQSQHGREIAAENNSAKTGSSNYPTTPTTTRTWICSDVPLLPYGQWMFLSRNVSRLLHWLQLLSAVACVVLSSMKLIMRNYGDVQKGETDKRNRKSALNIFYALALAEALLFLMEKAYWEWKVIYCKLLDEVNSECELGPLGLVSTRKFFYDAYSRCINGSIFDGLKMDMVSFAMDLLSSNSPDEKLVGVRILRQFAFSERFSQDTLQKIGINLSVVESLVEMLNWKDPEEEEIRKLAADILSKLASKKQNALRVAGIPGAMESISSLLHTNRSSCDAADEIGGKKLVSDHAGYDYWTFNHLGLLILKKLAQDHDNCGKIGNTRGLLPKIIDLSHAGERLLRDESVTRSQILTVKRSLQLLKMLASTTGSTGKHLRKEISEIVFTISNIRDILHYGEKHPMLQTLGIDILTNLGLEEEAKERIGGTGGVLKELFNIFFNQGIPECQNHVRTAAGEALAMLALESKSNCHRILKLDVLKRLNRALEVPLLRVNAARILRNLCSYSGAECFNQLNGIGAAAPTVLSAVMSQENKLQEVMVGLAAQLFKFITSEESSMIFQKAGITEEELAYKLLQILRQHYNPSAKVPRMRRFAIELAICMMRSNAKNILVFEEQGMEKELEGVLETTSELESFRVFSGTVGLSRHSIPIHSLVENALKQLKER
ncbi:hypothetical protein SLEP1_g29761 [Rubroshorea leprosula]|uniref:ARM repeat superfamily protein n=1 Tax=Rubroshorea leprosula TaxID=152421 RepID=A0AAV5K442_9ROSI|nr:hypothetical protein SLEP1_g29761 [Rubroshorea leprosula]